MVGIDNSVRQFCLCSLPYRGPQCNNLVIGLHHLAPADHGFTLPHLVHPTVEKEQFTGIFCFTALHRELFQIVFVCIQTADIPRKTSTHQSVKRHFSFEHIFKHIISGITVIALCKHTHTRHQVRLEQTLLSIGHTEAGFYQPKLRTRVRPIIVYLFKAGLYQTVYRRYATKAGQHSAHTAARRREFYTRLHRIQPLGFQPVYIALHHNAPPQHSRQLIFIALQQRQEVIVKLYFFINQ